MRDIKFRAWDKEMEAMRDWNTILCHDIRIFRYREWYELMQSTDLKDKNGTEIYEGDIVNYFKKGPSVIEWKDGGFIIKSEKANVYELFQNRVAEIEIIGNIYEHPHLLEGANQ